MKKATKKTVNQEIEELKKKQKEISDLIKIKQKGIEQNINEIMKNPKFKQEINKIKNKYNSEIKKHKFRKELGGIAKTLEKTINVKIKFATDIYNSLGGCDTSYGGHEIIVEGNPKTKNDKYLIREIENSLNDTCFIEDHGVFTKEEENIVNTLNNIYREIECLSQEYSGNNNFIDDIVSYIEE